MQHLYSVNSNSAISQVYKMFRSNREVHLTSTLMSRIQTKSSSLTENANDKETTSLQPTQLVNMRSVLRMTCRPSPINWWNLISWWRVSRDVNRLPKLDKLLNKQVRWKRACLGWMECWWTLRGCRKCTFKLTSPGSTNWCVFVAIILKRIAVSQ